MIGKAEQDHRVAPRHWDMSSYKGISALYDMQSIIAKYKVANADYCLTYIRY